MKELNFEPQLCKVCLEHMVCDSECEVVVEGLSESVGAEIFFIPDFSFCPCCGKEVSDDTREDKDYELRAIKYLREDE